MAQLKMSAIMVMIIEFVFVVSMLIGSLAALLNAITKFRAAATQRRIDATSQRAASTTATEWFRRVTFVFAVFVMVVSIVALLWMMFSANHQVTSQELALVAICVVNIIVAHMLMASAARGE
jgi:hypothetical protein